MRAFLEEYKRLLLLIKNGKQMGVEQRREVVSRAIRLENMLIKALTQRMLTGSLMLNVSQFPPRLRAVLQRMLNRRLHIIYCLEDERKKAQKMELDKKKEIEIISVLFNVKQKQMDNVGNLSPLQKIANIQSENTESTKKYMAKLSKSGYAKNF